MKQLPLRFDLWTYRCGVPSRAGLAQFTHLIRWEGDGSETMARGSGGRDPLHWRKAGTKAQFVESIRALMRDGKARTFNRICIEMTGTTADVWFKKAPDDALWSLVGSGELWWACEEGAVFFIHESAVTRDARAA